MNVNMTNAALKQERARLMKLIAAKAIKRINRDAERAALAEIEEEIIARINDNTMEDRKRWSRGFEV